MILEEIYRGWVEGRPETNKQLEEELGLEDKRRDVVMGILTGAGADQATVAAYSDWSAFSGGAANLETSIQRATADVRAAAAATGADVPDMYCGLWPGRSLTARTVRTPYGGVVLINTGLLSALTRFQDAVARSLGSLYGQVFRSDVNSQAEIAETLDWLMIECQAGVRAASVRQSVMQGPREQLRREMTSAALSYLIAHEAGHLAQNRPWRGTWRDDNQEFQVVRAAHDPGSEFDVTNAAASESIADMIACRILRRPPILESDEPSFAQAIGAISVLALQNAIFWRKAALTKDRLGWTHPYPEGRMFTLMLHLASPASQLAALEGEPDAAAAAAAEVETETEVAVRRFIDWSQNALGTTKYRLVAANRGLGNRGLNPASLAMLYATDPLIKQEPSDIVLSLGGN